jgi:BASS family bile acid:Na+ symporter
LIARLIKWAEHHPSTLLILGCIFGLAIPGLSGLSPFAAFVPVAGMIYFSCARLNLSDLHGVSPARTAAFYAFRFLALPLALYAVAHRFLPQFEDAVLLLSLMPAGSSATAMTMLHNGNPTLTMLYTVFSSALVPVTVAAAFSLVKGASVHVDTMAMLRSLATVIFIPSLAYFLLARRVPVVRNWTQRNARIGAVLMLAAMTFIVVVRQRDEILSSPAFAGPALVLLFTLQLIYYASGWLFPTPDGKIRISQALSSGAMNNALAIGLAAAYFPARTSLTMVLTEASWIGSLAAFGWFMRKKSTAS